MPTPLGDGEEKMVLEMQFKNGSAYKCENVPGNLEWKLLLRYN